MVYVSKKEQVKNILTELGTKTISAQNADISITLLNWTKEKIILSKQENDRNYFSKKFPKNPKNKPRNVKYGHIYGCNLGKNIGSEQNGKSRPVIVLQQNNPNSPTVIIAPLTGAYHDDGSKKKLYPYHVLIQDPNLTKESIIKLEHLRSISKNRLNEEMTDLTSNIEAMNEINTKLKKLLCVKLHIDKPE